MRLTNWANRPKRPARPRPPLRTTEEVAQMLGVSVQTFVAMISNHGGPAAFDPQRADKVRYWDPGAVQTWWNGLPPDIREVNACGKKRKTVDSPPLPSDTLISQTRRQP